MKKPKSNRRNYIVKPKVSKKLIISTVASVMAVVIALPLVWHALKVSVPVEANTLSGVSEALKDHGSGEAFIILDIVPGTTDDDLPLGTIGYLTSGQSQLEQYLAQEFIGGIDADLKSFDKREIKANNLANLAGISGDGYKYEESLAGGSGWAKIYDGKPFETGKNFSDDDSGAYYSSVVWGTAKPVKMGEGAYKLKESLEVQPTMMVADEFTSFSLADGPLYEGYKPYDEESVIIDDNYDEENDTPIYRFEDNKYIYCGTIGDVVARRNAWKDYEEAYKQYEIDRLAYEQYEKDFAEYEAKHKEWEEQQNQLKDNGEGDIGTDNDGEDADGDGDDNDGEDADGDGDDNDGEDANGDGDDSDGEDDKDDGNDNDGGANGSGGDNGDESEDGDGVDNEGEGESNETMPEAELNEAVSDLTASLVWIKFVGDDSVTVISETTPSETNDEAPTPSETGDEASTPSDTVADTPMDEPEAPEKVEKPIEPEPPEEDVEEDCEYITVEFDYVRVSSDEEPVEGLYIPDEYETVLYEEAVVMLVVDEDEADLLTAEDRITEDECILVYVGQGNGDYTITMGGKDAKELLVYNAPTYFRCFDVDLLKEYVFDDSGLNIKVNVKSAADVTIEDVKNADLIYLEDVPDRDKVRYISGGNDMSEAAVYNIIDRAVNDLTPVIVDYQVSQGGIISNADGKTEGMYSDTNYQKLASILLMTDLYSFFQDMDENVDNMLMNSGSGEYGRKSDADNHYVSNNIYVVNPSGILSTRNGFDTPFGDGEMEGFEEVKSAIDMENRQGNDLPGPSRAMAIQYIINYANSFIGEFRDFSILELQPTDGDSDLNTRNDSRNNTILYWRKPGSSGSGQQIIRSRKLITITMDTESVAQFSGEQSDINDKYQMIFIGLDGQSLNYDGKDTAYNDSSLNGKVYSGVGDIADGAGQRYDGIDITPQKKNALLDFMKAGYPIVVENNFFVDKTAKDAGAGDINTDYIDSSSQMYDFLRIALSSDDYKWCLYTIADVHTHYSDFAAQINVHRPSVEFDWGNAISGLNVNEVQMGQIVQTITADAEGKYRGYIPYKVTDDVGDSYSNSVNTRFYLDMNQDGRFDALEEVTGDVAISNGVLLIEFAAPERGIIPWKLEISDTGNSYRRDDLTGYFEIAHSTQIPIRVVQVIGGNVEDSLDAKFNFELAYEYDNGAGQKSLLGYYLKNAEALTNTKLEIETMTVGQLAEEIKFNEEYLSGADVLVLGFGPDCSLNVPVIDKNVEWYVNKYISEGRGVLVSSAASSEALGRMQLDASALGQKDVKTYNSLGRSKPSSVSYYKYSTLKSDMFFDWDLLSASMVNDGAVSHYPYEVGSGVRLGNTVKIADYVLDLASNGASDTVADVTAWYSLGDVEYFDTKTSYGVSVKDAANNYYIYSKGNVVFVGDYGYPYAYDSIATPNPLDNAQGTDNCKLFVNALMEAYSVGIKNPKVSIVAGLSDDSSETDSICIPYDEQIREIEADTDGALSSKGVLDDTVDVYFKVSEPNFAFKKDVTIAFYYEDNISGVPVDVGGRVVNATQFASEIWTVEQNQLVPVNVGSGLDLVPGKIYKIKAPVVSLRNDDNSVNADIYIVVQSHFIKLGQDRHPIGSDSVTLNRAQLFLLE